MYIYIYVYTRHREGLRVDVPRDPSPADPVQKLKDGKTENCIRRLTRAVPEGSPVGRGCGASRRNTKFKFKRPRRPSLLFLSDLVRPVRNWYIILIYGKSARGGQIHTDTPARA